MKQDKIDQIIKSGMLFINLIEILYFKRLSCFLAFYIILFFKKGVEESKASLADTGSLINEDRPKDEMRELPDDAIREVVSIL